MDDSNNVDLSISIVSYNTKDLLKTCLNSVYENSKGINLEVMVVDNNSKDGSAEMVEKEVRQVKLIRNRENVGFARANNQAIKESRGRYILLLNSDTVVISDALNKMINFMDSHPEAGAVGGKVFRPDFTAQPSTRACLDLRTLFISFFDLKKLVPPANRGFVIKLLGPLLGKTVRSYVDCYLDEEGPKLVDEVPGVCFCVRREVVEQVGLLDENFFMYYEDTDWSIRIKKKGWRLYILPEAPIIHYVQQSVKKVFNRTFVARCKGIYYYFEKHRDRRSILLLKIIVISALLLRIIGLSIHYPFTKSEKRDEMKGRVKSYSEIIKFSLDVWRNRFG